MPPLGRKEELQEEHLNIRRGRILNSCFCKIGAASMSDAKSSPETVQGWVAYVARALEEAEKLKKLPPVGFQSRGVICGAYPIIHTWTYTGGGLPEPLVVDCIESKAAIGKDVVDLDPERVRSLHIRTLALRAWKEQEVEKKAEKVRQRQLKGRLEKMRAEAAARSVGPPPPSAAAAAAAADLGLGSPSVWLPPSGTPVWTPGAFYPYVNRPW